MHQDESIASEIRRYSRLLVRLNLVHLFGGNISVREGDVFWITRTNTRKDDLGPEALVKIPIQTDQPVESASSAMPIHRAIYRGTSAQAIIHAHPYYATLLSFFREQWSPIDDTGILYLGGPVKSVQAPGILNWNDVAGEIAERLKFTPAVMLRWHGSFSIGESLSRAFHNTQALESAARFVTDIQALSLCLGNPQFPPYKAAPEQ